MIPMPIDPEIRKAACIIAVKCRRIIQGLLRDEEVADADREFAEIAEAVIRDLSAFKRSR